MNFRMIALVFAKDGKELLRDRRTLFVNVGLPVPLYPILALFAIQVMQLTRTTEEQVPQIALIDVPETLQRHLPTPQDLTSPDPSGSQPNPESSQPALSLDRVLKPQPAPDALAQAAQELLRNAKEDLNGPVLQQLREHGFVAALARRPLPQADLDEGDEFILLLDDAHRQQAVVSSLVKQSIKTYTRDRTHDRLQARDLPAHFIKPVNSQTIALAPPAEASRSKWAGIIPILLVFMAISGAFYPALDLIAGERERGTLESLLSWPGGRTEIFTGKLLVVIIAAVVSVILNLTSLGLTAGILNQQLADAGRTASTGIDMSFGIGLLAMCFLALLPLVIMLSAVSLALAGMAASFKEAQNYLSPLMLVVIVPAMLGMAPNAQPTIPLDLVPIVGPILALKASLQEPTIPWGHLALATAASAVMAIVVVTWSVRLLESERFLYPGLVRAGWGRWRKWGAQPKAPMGLEALALFAAATGAFLFSSTKFAAGGPVIQVVGPLVVCILVPALLHCFLGAYPPRTTLHLTRPPIRASLVSLLLIPIGLAMSLSIGQLHGHLLGEMPPGPTGLEILTDINQIGGWPLLLVCLALAPAICEEFLCRGPLLAGLNRSLGPIGGILLSSFCFAVLHASPWRLFPQFALGIVMAVLVWRCRSIWPAVMVHAGHNGLAVLADPQTNLLPPGLVEDWLKDCDSWTWSLILVIAAGSCTALLKAVPKAPESSRPQISTGPNGNMA